MTRKDVLRKVCCGTDALQEYAGLSCSRTELNEYAIKIRELSEVYVASHRHFCLGCHGGENRQIVRTVPAYEGWGPRKWKELIIGFC